MKFVTTPTPLKTTLLHPTSPLRAHIRRPNAPTEICPEICTESAPEIEPEIAPETAPEIAPEIAAEICARKCTARNCARNLRPKMCRPKVVMSGAKQRLANFGHTIRSVSPTSRAHQSGPLFGPTFRPAIRPGHCRRGIFGHNIRAQQSAFSGTAFDGVHALTHRQTQFIYQLFSLWYPTSMEACENL